MSDKPIGKTAKKRLKEEITFDLETRFKCVACGEIVTQAIARVPDGNVPLCPKDGCAMWPIK